MSETKRIDDVVELVIELLAEFPRGMTVGAIIAAIGQGEGIEPLNVVYALGYASALGHVTAIRDYDARGDLLVHWFRLVSASAASEQGDHADK